MPSPSRLSQSYSQPRTLSAVEERLMPEDATTGTLERLDASGEWRLCRCELRGGKLRVLAPGETGARERLLLVDESDSDVDDVFAEALEELAVDEGLRGRRCVTLNLTKCRVVGTSPPHGPTCFKLVVERSLGDVASCYFRAKTYDEMCTWLIGFHRGRRRARPWPT